MLWSPLAEDNNKVYVTMATFPAYSTCQYYLRVVEDRLDGSVSEGYSHCCTCRFLAVWHIHNQKLSKYLKERQY